MWTGAGCSIVGGLNFLVGHSYVTAQAGQADSEMLLSNIMGICFWGGLLLACVGMVMLLLLFERLLGRR